MQKFKTHINNVSKWMYILKCFNMDDLFVGCKYKRSMTKINVWIFWNT